MSACQLTFALRCIKLCRYIFHKLHIRAKLSGGLKDLCVPFVFLCSELSHPFFRWPERSVHHRLSGYALYYGTVGRVQRREGMGEDQPGPQLGETPLMCICALYIVQSPPG